MRGRIAALTQMQPGFIAIGGIVGGLGAEWLGLRTFCVATALCALAVSITIYASSPALRRLRLSRLSAEGGARRHQAPTGEKP